MKNLVASHLARLKKEPPERPQRAPRVQQLPQEPVPQLRPKQVRVAPLAPPQWVQELVDELAQVAHSCAKKIALQHA